VVGFGGKPLAVSDELVEQLQQRVEGLETPLLSIGERVRIVSGSFADMDAIFMEMDGERRVILLINMLNRQQSVSLPLTTIARH
jgi:transcriptional antiterminator RfaH